VTLGYSSRVGIEADRTKEGILTVYLPGSPNAWSDEVHIVKSDQNTPIDRPVMAAIGSDKLHQLGFTYENERVMLNAVTILFVAIFQNPDRPNQTYICHKGVT